MRRELAPRACDPRLDDWLPRPPRLTDNEKRRFDALLKIMPEGDENTSIADLPRQEGLKAPPEGEDPELSSLRMSLRHPRRRGRRFKRYALFCRLRFT